MSFCFHRLAIPEVILIETQNTKDDRGLFVETYKQSEFRSNGILEVFVQDNYSHSIHCVLRGLHYQLNPQAQGKLVMALAGEIYDVAVDIRRSSPTYGKWVNAILSADNRRMLYIPSGFAHGFCVLSSEAHVLYKVTEEYAPELDRGIIWNDPKINIKWPTTQPILSPKDFRLPLLKEAENNL